MRPPPGLLMSPGIGRPPPLSPRVSVFTQQHHRYPDQQPNQQQQQQQVRVAISPSPSTSALSPPQLRPPPPTYTYSTSALASFPTPALGTPEPPHTLPAAGAGR